MASKIPENLTTSSYELVQSGSSISLVTPLLDGVVLYSVCLSKLGLYVPELPSTYGTRLGFTAEKFVQDLEIKVKQQASSSLSSCVPFVPTSSSLVCLCSSPFCVQSFTTTPSSICSSANTRKHPLLIGKRLPESQGERSSTGADSQTHGLTEARGRQRAALARLGQ